MKTFRGTRVYYVINYVRRLAALINRVARVGWPPLTGFKNKNRYLISTFLKRASEVCFCDFAVLKRFFVYFDFFFRMWRLLFFALGLFGRVCIYQPLNQAGHRAESWGYK